MEVKGNVIIHGSYIDIHDNDVVNLSVDKADVKVNGKNITEIEKENKNSTSENVIGENKEIPETPQSVKECFRFTSEFVKQHVQAIIKDFYLNKPVNLAIIERTLYDHNILHKSNNHTSFICALMDWGILPEDIDIRKVANGMATKFKSFPQKGYKQWNDDHLNDRTLCNNIGKKLPESMKYNR